jgi:hypothetical protein
MNSLAIGGLITAAALYGATLATLKTWKGICKMYGSIPRDQWPSVSTRETARRRNIETLAAETRNRAAERRAINSPWPLDKAAPQPAAKPETTERDSARLAATLRETLAAADTTAKAAEFSEKETGRRVKITALIPETAETEQWQAAIDLLEFNLMMVFGGFTWQPFNGGWMNDQGDFIRDHGRAYLVSFEQAKTDKGRADYERAIRLFQETGRAIGEEWLHIEVSSFSAEHTKTG